MPTKEQKDQAVKFLMDLKDQTDKCIVITLASRQGSQLFITKLEYEHFPPRTPRNLAFQFAMAMWEEMLFYVVVVPKEETDLVHQVVNELGMRLAPDSTLVLFDGSGDPKKFPVWGDHIFMLEGIWQGDEKEAVDAILEADQPKRAAHVRSHLKVFTAPRTYLDGWVDTLKGYPKLYERLMQSNNDLVECYVLMFGDDPVGFVTLCMSDNDGAYIGMLWVEEHYRRLGVADRLLQVGIANCMHKDLGRLKIESQSTVLDKALAHIPEPRDGIVEITALNDDLFIEQEQIGPRNGRS